MLSQCSWGPFCSFFHLLLIATPVGCDPLSSCPVTALCCAFSPSPWSPGVNSPFEQCSAAGWKVPSYHLGKPIPMSGLLPFTLTHHSATVIYQHPGACCILATRQNP